MEFIDSIWIVGIAAFVGGGVIGAILYRLIAPAARNVVILQTQLEEAERALEEYKTKVSSHFEKTSDLVNELTEDYVKVYKHLADGAQMLGDPEKVPTMLGQQPGESLISFTGAGEDDTIDAESQEIISEAVKEAAEAVKQSSGETESAEHQPEETISIAGKNDAQTPAAADAFGSGDQTKAANDTAKSAGTGGEEIGTADKKRETA